jgi:NAD dependent epimerase/dehydratase family enzyme
MAQAQQAGQPNRSQPKPYGKNRFAHTANTKYGMGDNYGTGIKAKLGRVREDMMGNHSVTPKKLKTPPRGLA